MLDVALDLFLGFERAMGCVGDTLHSILHHWAARIHYCSGELPALYSEPSENGVPRH